MRFDYIYDESMSKVKSKRYPTLEELHPELSEEQLREVKEVLDKYLESTLRQYQRIRSDPVAHREFIKLLREEQEKKEKRQSVDSVRKRG